MAGKLTIDKRKTAVLIMDYQNEIVQMLPPEKQKPLLERARAPLEAARRVGLTVIHVVARFRDGYPEISQHNKVFSGLKKAGRLREGTPGTEVRAEVAPRPGEIVITKHRAGSFEGTDLETILRANEINTLVLLGIATSGCVLTTVRWAADLDYELVVLSDEKSNFKMHLSLKLSAVLIKVSNCFSVTAGSSLLLVFGLSTKSAGLLFIFFDLYNQRQNILVT